MSLRDQIRDLVSYGQSRHPGWEAGWFLLMEDDTLARLDSELRHAAPGSRAATTGAELHGCLIQTPPVGKDLVCLEPRWDVRALSRPPRYVLDLANGGTIDRATTRSILAASSSQQSPDVPRAHRQPTAGQRGLGPGPAGPGSR